MPAPYTEFRLSTTIVVAGVETPIVVPIEEPVKWDGIRITVKRDRETHGLNYEYSDGKAQVDFTCESSGALLSQQYYTYGSDAIVRFLIVDILRDGTEKAQVFKVDFNDIVIQPGKVSASIIRDDLNERLQARKDSPISLGLSKTLDNTFVTPPLAIDLALPGQAIREKGETVRIGVVDEAKEFAPPKIITPYTLFPNLLSPPGSPVTNTPNIDPQTGLAIPAIPDISALEGVRLLAGDIMEGTETDLDIPFIPCQESGEYTLEIDWVFRFIMTVFKGGGLLDFSRARFAGWRIAPVLLIDRPGENRETIALCPMRSGSGDVGDSPLMNFDGHYSGTVSVTKGTRIYLCTQMLIGVSPNVKKLRFSWATLTARVSIDRTTRAADSRGQAFLLPAALKHVFGIITNAIDSDTNTGNIYGGLISKASGSQVKDGYGTEYCVSSGFQLRNLSSKPPTFTFKDLYGVLSAHHAAGLLYETDGAGNNKVRIEEGLWFYRGGRILVIDEVYSYKEQPNQSLLVNKVVVGYAKFPDTGPGSLYEFNTTRTYQTPIVTNEATKEITCPLIAAGTAIEEARSLGIPTYDVDGNLIDRSGEGGSYDDDGFLLHVTSAEEQDLITFSVVNLSIFPFPNLPRKTFQFASDTLANPKDLQVGDIVTFTGTGTANDNIPFTISAVLDPNSTIGKWFGITHRQYQVVTDAPLVAAGPVLGSWNSGSQPVKIRTNERLDVDGVADPSSTYNLELSPARMLRRHARFLNSGFRYKQAIDELRCIDYKNNRDMVSQVRDGMGPLPGDEDRQLIVETGDIALGELDHFNKLWSPEEITATVYMPKSDMESLLLALRNSHPDNTLNMGFITIKNADGEYVDADVMDLSYNPHTEVADLVLWKRMGDPITGGPACIDYAEWQYQRFETDPSKDPNIYRFCRFRDFRQV